MDMRLFVLLVALALGCKTETTTQHPDSYFLTDMTEVDYGRPGDAGMGDLPAGADLSLADLRPPPPDLAPLIVSRFPQSVLECSGTSYLQLDEHAVDSNAAEMADDLRTGSCTPTACTTGGKQSYGIDLEFPAMLPSGAMPVAASLTVRAMPKDGDPATFTVFDYESGNSIGACIIDKPSQQWGECNATLGPLNLLDASAPTKIYVEVTSSTCAVSFDFVKLTMTGVY